MAAAGKGKGKDGKGKGKGKALAIVLAAKAKGKGKGKKGSGTPDQKETVESPVRNMEESEVGHTPSMDEHEKKKQNEPRECSQMLRQPHRKNLYAKRGSVKTLVTRSKDPRKQ